MSKPADIPLYNTGNGLKMRKKPASSGCGSQKISTKITMSEDNKKKDPVNNGSADDDEFESLSHDEKAAFEKIMAEIAEAENPGAGVPPGNESESKEKEEETSSDPSHDEEAETASDDSASPTISSADNDTENSDDSLDENQQAMLDQIMAGIKDKKDKDIDMSVQNDDEIDDKLSEDQQAALDQIMAETGENQKEDTDEDEVSSDDSKDDDSLSDDQQAALDQIMAEIGKNQKEDTDEDEVSSDDSEDDDSLSDDQQATLDQIMAEINTKKKEGVPETPNEDSEPADEEAEEESETGLSLDEFGSELEQLLKSNESKNTDDEKSEAEPQETENDELSSSESDQPEPEPEPAVNAEGSDPTNENVSAQNDFPILKEVGVEDAPPVSPKNTQQKNKLKTLAKGKAWLKSVMIITSVAAVVFIVGIGAYWGYKAYFSRQNINILANHSQTGVTQLIPEPSTNSPPVEPSADEPVPKNAIRKQPTVNATEENNPMVSLASQLALGRQQLQTKISEIDDLTAYYKKGIEEDRQQLRGLIQQGHYNNVDQARKDPKILLALQTVQRRMAYIDSLEIPLYKVRQGAEELLFFERHAQLYAILTTYTSGTSLSEFEQKALQQLQHHLEQSRHLKIDNIEGKRLNLKNIWDEMLNTPAKTDQISPLIEDTDPLNAAISKEICNGDYSRRYQLTGVSVKTATCLLNWGGKDLYLNEVKTLSPSAAKILAQWKGDWLSLNGLKELSAESAGYLAKWTGKRLSMNGLTRLSPKATVALSQWKGEQLEMIGLVEIGPWENYGTRLFLSEQLKKKIEGR